MYHIPSGYLTVCHGKSPFLIGKPSISMGHLYHGYVSHNQRVHLFEPRNIFLSRQALGLVFTGVPIQKGLLHMSQELIPRKEGFVDVS